MAVFDLVKNGVACLSNPLEQFFGIKFQERSLAKLSPLRSMRIIVGIDCHSASCNNRLSSTTTKPSLEARTTPKSSNEGNPTKPSRPASSTSTLLPSSMTFRIESHCRIREVTILDGASRFLKQIVQSQVHEDQ